MKQLDHDQIAAIVEEIKATQFVRARYTHPWVTEDGAYDDESGSARNFFWNRFCYYTASRSWVENQEANQRLPEWMRAPWGSYPTQPTRPAKKK